MVFDKTLWQQKKGASKKSSHFVKFLHRHFSKNQEIEIKNHTYFFVCSQKPAFSVFWPLWILYSWLSNNRHSKASPSLSDNSETLMFTLFKEYMDSEAIFTLSVFEIVRIPWTIFRAVNLSKMNLLYLASTFTQVIKFRKKVKLHVVNVKSVLQAVLFLTSSFSQKIYQGRWILHFNEKKQKITLDLQNSIVRSQ